MFTLRFHIGFDHLLPVLTRQGDETSGRVCRGGRIFRVAVGLGFLALGLPATSSAQGLGTMQVAARVVPASVGWSGVAEAGVAARSAAVGEPGRAVIRRAGLIQATAQIFPSRGPAGGRRLLIVTLQHPHN